MYYRITGAVLLLLVICIILCHLHGFFVYRKHYMYWTIIYCKVQLLVRILLRTYFFLHMYLLNFIFGSTYNTIGYIKYNAHTFYYCTYECFVLLLSSIHSLAHSFTHSLTYSSSSANSTYVRIQFIYERTRMIKMTYLVRSFLSIDSSSGRSSLYDWSFSLLWWYYLIIMTIIRIISLITLYISMIITLIIKWYNWKWYH